MDEGWKDKRPILLTYEGAGKLRHPRNKIISSTEDGWHFENPRPDVWLFFITLHVFARERNVYKIYPFFYKLYYLQ